MQFVGAVRLGEFVEAHCEIVRLTRAITFMRCRLVVGTRIVANAAGVWKIRGEQ
jgi:acyl-coenzyme A thioesterase PaaI-like protein